MSRGVYSPTVDRMWTDTCNPSTATVEDVNNAKKHHDNLEYAMLFHIFLSFLLME